MKKIFWNYNYKEFAGGYFAFDVISEKPSDWEKYHSWEKSRQEEWHRSLREEQEAINKEAISIRNRLGIKNDETCGMNCLDSPFFDDEIHLNDEDGQKFQDELIRLGWVKEYIPFGP